jgi:hypothetical protein
MPLAHLPHIHFNNIIPGALRAGRSGVRKRGKVKRPGPKVTHSSPYSDEVKKSGAKYLLSLRTFTACTMKPLPLATLSSKSLWIIIYGSGLQHGVTKILGIHEKGSNCNPPAYPTTIWFYCVHKHSWRRGAAKHSPMRREEKPTRCHWMVHCTYNMLNMFRALLCPSSGDRNYMCVITAYGVRFLGCWLSEVRCRAAWGMLLAQHPSFRTHSLLPWTWPPTTSN